MKLLLFVLYIILSLLDLYYAGGWTRKGIFQEANRIFSKWLIKEKYNTVTIFKIFFMLLVIVISACLWNKGGKLIIIIANAVQLYILFRYWQYKKIYDNEIRRYK